MKLVSFSTAELPRPHLGLVRDDEVVDVDLAGQALKLAAPDQMLELIDNYADGQQVLQAILAKTAGRRFSQVRTFSDIGAAHALSEVQLAAPIPRPRKNVLCLAVNYRAHAQETAGLREHKGEAPSIPVFFTKAPTSINSPYGQIEIDPAVSSEIDWEVELAVIIGKSGKNIRQEDALSHIFGYTVLNDITARDLQSKHKQFFKGKSLDGSCPMGPWIVTADEIADPQALNLSLHVNGETKQSANTSQMIFSIAQTIAVLSAGMTLEAGDIIATGTPSGVGFSRNPPEFLKPGDIVEAEVEGVGLIRNSIVGQ
ncbi:FAA hydrolase family protein [Ktedonosporobacter rubrisoli]|uniref:FAA hydrolase family protein n=1 Tax=Ktedonosporobacter rubrisoli TaxID=2509675 RepID=A0A4P6JZP8_KTERU|nr:fumarylacetoacetate hydrolase family protein [Ktedonosporobacter rubrisoli]QBD80880.1 FAA hydrolase family protein [Ktedonosporobacter rubrisoli]